MIDANLAFSLFIENIAVTGVIEVVLISNGGALSQGNNTQHSENSFQSNKNNIFNQEAIFVFNVPQTQSFVQKQIIKTLWNVV